MKAIPCPPDVVPLLGVISDAEIARRVERARSTVQRWRAERGIAAAPARGIAAECPDDVEPLLGVISDAEIARRVGRTRTTVQRWRAARGIAALQRGANLRGQFPDRFPEQHQHRLTLWGDGLSDAEIAERVGVHRNTIVQWRVKWT